MKMTNSLIPLSLKDRKEVFLEKYKSVANLSGYKRYLGSPLRYAGGKSLAVGLIVNKFPDKIEKLVSPFIGGASLEIAVANELGIPVVGYDVFDLLINYWQIQLKNPEQLYQRLSELEATKEEFKVVKDRLMKHWKGEKKLRSKYELAMLYYFNHNTSYGPAFLAWQSSVYLKEKRYKKMLEKVRSFRAPNLEVFCESFETSIPKHKKDFLYCDPPYYLGDRSKMFAGIYPSRNITVHHKGFNHKLLRDLLKEHEGGFILSYNDCPTIRGWYKDFDMCTPKWQYTMGQGETRIGKNRINGNGTNVKKSHELLIWNY